jgi:hypothetical protein
MNNNESPALNFPDSVSHNILWIKKMSEEHDCSQGLAASAALMTMHMMDHHKMNERFAKLENDIAVITAAICPSNS